MTILGTIKELYISITEEPFRVKKEHLALDEQGVLDDKFYGKDPARAILITSQDAYSMTKEIGIDLDEGLLGENILIDGSIKELQIGDQFVIGDVTFELAQNCTLCKGLSKIDAHLPKLLKDDRGIFIRALNSGTIKIGDDLFLNKN
jgi:MOSC domain-containing protein YiiM